MKITSERFTISNLDPLGYRFIRRFSEFGFALVGITAIIAGVINKPGKPWTVLAGLLFASLGILFPLVSARAAKAEVQFDGKYISHRSLLRTLKIDIQEIKSVDYRHESVSNHACDAVYLDIIYYDESTITFTDSVPKCDVEHCINGNYSGNPLLSLYDDIINTYPDKASSI